MQHNKIIITCETMLITILEQQFQVLPRALTIGKAFLACTDFAYLGRLFSVAFVLLFLSSFDFRLHATWGLGVGVGISMVSNTFIDFGRIFGLLSQGGIHWGGEHG